MRLSLKVALFLLLPLALLLLGVERCTTVNLASPGFLRPAEYDAYPLLKDGVESETYRLEALSNPYRARITYSPESNFFLVADRQFRKLDGAGRQVFAVERDAVTVNPPFSPFLVGPLGIYDLSRDEVILEPFAQVLNADADRTFTKDTWRKVFDQTYAKADSVVHGDYQSDIRKYASYFKIGDDWVLIHTSTSAIEVERDYDFGSRIPGYPAKFDRMILLRDPQRGLFSHDSSEIREDLGRFAPEADDFTELPERGLRYRSDVSLETLFFDKGFVSNEAAYTSIPLTLAGRADHRLRIGQEELNFWEVAVRDVFSPLDTTMSVFVLPEAYENRSDVVFLEFNPGNNVETAGSDGLYVVRKKAAEGD